jgi:uncharacterized protein YjbJ (UPF0337 family)
MLAIIEISIWFLGPGRRRGTLHPLNDCLHMHIEEIVMGRITDKIKGAANEAIGKAKQRLGEATGSDQMKGEGAIQEAKGHGQKAVGHAKDAAKEAINKAAELANRKL